MSTPRPVNLYGAMMASALGILNKNEILPRQEYYKLKVTRDRQASPDTPMLTNEESRGGGEASQQTIDIYSNTEALALLQPPHLNLLLGQNQFYGLVFLFGPTSLVVIGLR